MGRSISSGSSQEENHKSGQGHAWQVQTQLFQLCPWQNLQSLLAEGSLGKAVLDLMPKDRQQQQGCPQGRRGAVRCCSNLGWQVYACSAMPVTGEGGPCGLNWVVAVESQGIVGLTPRLGGVRT